MRVLKSGKVELREVYKTCLPCGAEFAYVPADIKADREGRYINCPCCGAFIAV